MSKSLQGTKNPTRFSRGSVNQLFQQLNQKVVALAPTGKAARRIRESTGLEACTIHRALGWGEGGVFTKDEKEPLHGDVFLVDESSMIDVVLASALFRAIPRHARVVLVGDVQQLPSVGAGTVLQDLIESGVIPVVKLTQIFRQAAQSQIIQASYAVSQGKVPDMELLTKEVEAPTTDALWLRCENDKIIPAIRWLLSTRLPSWGVPVSDVQLLSPMNAGDIGNKSLNLLAQEILNPVQPGIPSIRQFRQGDRVLQMVNNYDREVFNGDIGAIAKIDQEEDSIWVRFAGDTPEGRLVEYTTSDLDDLTLAYSISVHKSQGSDFPLVILPVSTLQFVMLRRKLLYTAMTRAKQLLIVVGGDKRAMDIAVRTAKDDRRYSGLRDRLV